MKFLRNTSLFRLGTCLIILLSVIFVVEYGVIRIKFDDLTEANRKMDFVRKAELGSQQIAMMVQRFQHHDQQLATEIEVMLEEQDNRLRILKKGGRVDDTDTFIEPLSRLPGITLQHLEDNWQKYKESIAILFTEDSLRLQQHVQADSTGQQHIVNRVERNSNYDNAVRLVNTKWIVLTNSYNVLVKDIGSEATAAQASVQGWLLFFAIGDIGLLLMVYWFFYRFVLKPINILKESTFHKQQVNDLPPNEVGNLATRINETLENLKDATDFVMAIGEGNLEIDYREKLDNGYDRGKNELADSLIVMQGKLKAMNEEERKRQWSNEGLAKFVDILRSSSDNIQTLGDTIIASLVQYTKSNQGGLYILNDEDESNKFLELISLFAFDIKKFEQRRVKLGEGILGQTFLEKETTYLNSVPEEYIRITSGLGDAPPKTVLMVPLKVDKDVYGIVELASFQEFKQHEIAFVEKLGESIASTLAAVRAAERNKQLIEQFQQQTEEMKAQEEEMRQNMEELQATQEEISRKERSYISRIKELENQDKGANKVEAAELETARSTFARKEQEYLTRIRELEVQLAQKPVRSDDWALAEELAKELKINLEALQITREELLKK